MKYLVSMQSIFDYYSRLRCSHDALGDIMFAEGFKDKYGKSYKARKFEEILKNPFYIGKFLWNGEIYDRKYKAIISRKLFYEECLEFSSEWKGEKDILFAEIDESSKSNKILYCNIDTLIEFCHKMP